MFGSGKILVALATIKADTKNHNGELQEFKKVFEKHVDKEEKLSTKTDEKIDAVHCAVKNFECPHNERIDNVEQRAIDHNKKDERRRTADADKKVEEIKERAKKDLEVAEHISSLKAARKYSYLSMTGLWAVAAVVLKKVFT
jgi:hypothetical protein